MGHACLESFIFFLYRGADWVGRRDSRNRQSHVCAYLSSYLSAHLSSYFSAHLSSHVCSYLSSYLNADVCSDKRTYIRSHFGTDARKRDERTNKCSHIRPHFGTDARSQRNGRANKCSDSYSHRSRI